VAQPRDFLREIRRKIASVTFLQFGALPIFASQCATALGRAAFTLKGIVIIVRCRPIVSKLFTGANVAQGDEGNLAAHSEIRVAGMIAVKHLAVPLALGYGRDKQIVADLNFDRAKTRRDLPAQLFARDDMTAFHRDDLAFGDVGRGEQAAPMNLALPNFRFG